MVTPQAKNQPPMAFVDIRRYSRVGMAAAYYTSLPVPGTEGSLGTVGDLLGVTSPPTASVTGTMTPAGTMTPSGFGGMDTPRMAMADDDFDAAVWTYGPGYDGYGSLPSMSSADHVPKVVLPPIRAADDAEEHPTTAGAGSAAAEITSWQPTQLYAEELGALAAEVPVDLNDQEAFLGMEV
jgi:hypothetical protein